MGLLGEYIFFLYFHTVVSWVQILEVACVAACKFIEEIEGLRSRLLEKRRNLCYVNFIVIKFRCTIIEYYCNYVVKCNFNFIYTVACKKIHIFNIWWKSLVVLLQSFFVGSFLKFHNRQRTKYFFGQVKVHCLSLSLCVISKEIYMYTKTRSWFEMQKKVWSICVLWKWNIKSEEILCPWAWIMLMV